MTIALPVPLDRPLLALCGFVAGCVAGLLLAPEEGPATRRRLQSSMRDAAAAAQQRARTAAEPLAARVRTVASALAERHIPFADEIDMFDGTALARDLARPSHR